MSDYLRIRQFAFDIVDGDQLYGPPYQIVYMKGDKSNHFPPVTSVFLRSVTDSTNTLVFDVSDSGIDPATVSNGDIAVAMVRVKGYGRASWKGKMSVAFWDPTNYPNEKGVHLSFFDSGKMFKPR